jgi:hypothetical protein
MLRVFITIPKLIYIALYFFKDQKYFLQNMKITILTIALTQGDGSCGKTLASADQHHLCCLMLDL